MAHDPPEFPRPLTEREAGTLRFVLSVDDPRIDPLREQAKTATVVGMCPCGCATIDVAVDRARSRAAEGLRSPAIDAVTKTFDESGVLGLILFLTDGWLDSLEIYGAYGKGVPPPAIFPDSDRFNAPEVNDRLP
jgi:hypothetical protein